MKNKKIFWGISCVIILIGLITFFVSGGFAKDITYSGGTKLVIDMGKEVDVAEVTSLVKDTATDSNPVVEKLEDNKIGIRSSYLETETLDAVKKALNEKYELTDSSYLSVNKVSPAAGLDFQMQLLKTILIVIAIIILIFISVKFAFSAAISLIIALIHDILIVLTAYVLFRLPMNLSFMALLLVLIGYAICNNLMVFHRIRANRKRLKTEPFGEVVDLSIKQSVNGIIYFLIAALFLVVLLCIMGSTAIKLFAVLMMVALISSSYSTIYIASPVWAALNREYDADEDEKTK